MGRFFNPDNSAFQKILNSEIYVDKSQLISYTNRMINTEQAFICHPVGFTMPMEPRDSVGIRSCPILAHAVPQRPSASRSL